MGDLVLGSLTDRWIGRKDGSRLYTGRVFLFREGCKRETIATVYGKTIREMRKRKRVVYDALKQALQ